MNIDKYANWTRSTAIYPDAGTGSLKELSYLTLGLTNESGEVAGKLKKVLRDDGEVISPEKSMELIAELGDVFWYLVRLCDALHVPPFEVLQMNQAKLNSRKSRGAIGGSGDKR